MAVEFGLERKKNTDIMANICHTKYLVHLIFISKGRCQNFSMTKISQSMVYSGKES